MENYDLIGETEEEKGIFIKGKKYSYSIIRSENEEDSIIIKIKNQLNISLMRHLHKN